jgi:CheY-like chemotaxis protein
VDADRLHILVVDDLTDMADSTAEVLAFWGYDATACDSGATALACACARRPAVVLLDLVMPRMDGFQFALAFRALKGCRTVPLVALSGYWSPESAARAFQAGIGHYLVKPADPDQLKALLGSLTQSRGGSSGLQAGKRRRPRGTRSRRRPAPTGAVPASAGIPAWRL